MKVSHQWCTKVRCVGDEIARVRRAVWRHKRAGIVGQPPRGRHDTEVAKVRLPTATASRGSAHVIPPPPAGAADDSASDVRVGSTSERVVYADPPRRVRCVRSGEPSFGTLCCLDCLPWPRRSPLAVSTTPRPSISLRRHTGAARCCGGCSAACAGARCIGEGDQEEQER